MPEDGRAPRLKATRMTYLITAQSINGKVYLRRTKRRWSLVPDDTTQYKTSEYAKRALREARERFGAILKEITLEYGPN
jgi:hypothetical protein